MASRWKTEWKRLVLIAAVFAALAVQETIFDRVLFAWASMGCAFGPLLLVTALRGPVSPGGTIASMLLGFWLSVAAYAAKQIGLLGAWSGEYICNQGLTGMTLLITRVEPDIRAVFAFYELAENPGVPDGCFEMAGSFDPSTGRLDFAAGRWIHRPEQYFTVDLEGRAERETTRRTVVRTGEPAGAAAATAGGWAAGLGTRFSAFGGGRPSLGRAELANFVRELATGLHKDHVIVRFEPHRTGPAEVKPDLAWQLFGEAEA